ncbi:hypothetical protein L1887_33123 [Cichorium endivia]|nr:hypothetical protein L1887_33123 [Cichorium endivia]
MKLQVAKRQSAPSAPREQPVTKSTLPLRVNHVADAPAQLTVERFERSGTEAFHLVYLSKINLNLQTMASDS